MIGIRGPRNADTICYRIMCSHEHTRARAPITMFQFSDANALFHLSTQRSYNTHWTLRTGLSRKDVLVRACLCIRSHTSVYAGHTKLNKWMSASYEMGNTDTHTYMHTSTPIIPKTRNILHRVGAAAHQRWRRHENTTNRIQIAEKSEMLS